MISFQPALSNRHFSGQLVQAAQDQEQESPTIGSKSMSWESLLPTLRLMPASNTQSMFREATRNTISWGWTCMGKFYWGLECCMCKRGLKMLFTVHPTMNTPKIWFLGIRFLRIALKSQHSLVGTVSQNRQEINLLIPEQGRTWAILAMGISLVAWRLKRLPAMRETWVRPLGWEDPLEKEMATHSSILGWRIPWTEEPDGLQSVGSQRVRHDWAHTLSLFTVRPTMSWSVPRPWWRTASCSLTAHYSDRGRGPTMHCLWAARMEPSWLSRKKGF